MCIFPFDLSLCRYEFVFTELTSCNVHNIISNSVCCMYYVTTCYMTACKNSEFLFCFLFFSLTRQRWAKSIIHISVYVKTKYTRIVHISLTIATHIDVESHTAHIDKNEFEFELEMNKPNQTKPNE